ncbi:chemotaxis protein, partial [Rhizobium phaseoli]
HGRNRIIATNPTLLFSRFTLANPAGRAKGSDYDDHGSIVAFARPLGYEDYGGLGWDGVVAQQTESDATIKAALNLK